MKTLITAWTCDRCDESVQLDGKLSPDHWLAVRAVAMGEAEKDGPHKEQAFHFCAECALVVSSAMRCEVQS